MVGKKNVFTGSRFQRACCCLCAAARLAHVGWPRMVASSTLPPVQVILSTAIYLK